MLTKAVNLISPIPELKKRTIFIEPDGRIKINMEDFIVESRTTRTPEMAILWAEGYRDAYMAIGIHLRIDTESSRDDYKWENISSPARFLPRIIPYEQQRKYFIQGLPDIPSPSESDDAVIQAPHPRKFPWLITINLDASAYERRLSSSEEALSYADGFRCGYRETGISIEKYEKSLCF